jgi:hypothetical protein
VESYDRFGRIVQPPKLLLAGTESVVKSRAQVCVLMVGGVKILVVLMVCVVVVIMVNEWRAA